MEWKKLGLIYGPQQTIEWQKKFVMLPTPIQISDDILRIYLGFAGDNNVGRIGYVDVNAHKPTEIKAVSQKPVLDIGEKGCFDDNGVVPISVLRKGNEIWLYYIGFQLGVQVPYYMFCGLAISKDNGSTFERVSKAPILDRTNDELYARCGVNVIYDEKERKHRMWYIGSYGEGWTMSQGKLKPLYIMKTLESIDGVTWMGGAKPVQCLEYGNADEHGFGRPFVWYEHGLYRMFYSIRTYSRGYYIGYAESLDGYHWDRQDDKTGIDLSKEGWDDTNLSYPFLYRVDGKTYMFYNGNGCGVTGFGVAELIE